MRAWRQTDTGVLELELAAPIFTGEDVLVAVEATALTADDLRANTNPLRTPGGAAVGTVVATGDQATHMQGARVLVGPLQPCGECDRCRRGAVASCPDAHWLGRTADGTLASHVVAKARWVCALTDGLSLPGPTAAAVPGDLAAAYAMYTRCGVAPGEPVIIVGSSARSRLLSQVAVAKGTKPIVVPSELPSTDAADAATSGGLRAVHRGDDLDDLSQRVQQALADGGLGLRPWRVFDADATLNSRSAAFALAQPATTLTLWSAPGVCSASEHTNSLGQGRVDLEGILANNCTILGVAGAHPDLLCECAALVARGDITFDALADCTPVASAIHYASSGNTERIAIALLDAPQ